MKLTMYAIPLAKSDGTAAPLNQGVWAIFWHELNAKKFNPNKCKPVEVVVDFRRVRKSKQAK